MDSIASIDMNMYPGLVQSFSPYTAQELPAVQKIPTETETEQNSNGGDLSNYYSNIRPEDYVASVGENVKKSAEALDKAMISALQSGMSVNDVINMKMAQVAYNANINVFNATFEIEV